MTLLAKETSLRACGSFGIFDLLLSTESRTRELLFLVAAFVLLGYVSRKFTGVGMDQLKIILVWFLIFAGVWACQQHSIEIAKIEAGCER